MRSFCLIEPTMGSYFFLVNAFLRLLMTHHLCQCALKLDLRSWSEMRMLLCCYSAAIRTCLMQIWGRVDHWNGKSCSSLQLIRESDSVMHYNSIIVTLNTVPQIEGEFACDLSHDCIHFYRLHFFSFRLFMSFLLEKTFSANTNDESLNNISVVICSAKEHNFCSFTFFSPNDKNSYSNPKAIQMNRRNRLSICRWKGLTVLSFSGFVIIFSFFMNALNILHIFAQILYKI